MKAAWSSSHSNSWGSHGNWAHHCMRSNHEKVVTIYQIASRTSWLRLHCFFVNWRTDYQRINTLHKQEAYQSFLAPSGSESVAFSSGQAQPETSPKEMKASQAGLTIRWSESFDVLNVLNSVRIFISRRQLHAWRYAATTAILCIDGLRAGILFTQRVGVAWGKSL